MKESDIRNQPEDKQKEMLAAITAELRILRQLVLAATDDGLPPETKAQRVEAAHNCGAFLLRDPDAAEIVRLTAKPMTAL